jgi:alcohol dehydrogenase, propanol-preferring
VTGFQIGDRAGVPWLHSACGDCEFCTSGRETLCEAQRNSGYSVNGGYAEFMPADALRRPDHLQRTQGKKFARANGS